MKNNQEKKNRRGDKDLKKIRRKEGGREERLTWLAKTSHECKVVKEQFFSCKMDEGVLQLVQK